VGRRSNIALARKDEGEWTAPPLSPLAAAFGWRQRVARR
jgi:hypothetical protein